MTDPSLDKIPITQLKGVGPALEKKFNQIGIYNVQDLLFHLPFRYEDRTRVHQIENHALNTYQGSKHGCKIATPS